MSPRAQQYAALRREHNRLHSPCVPPVNASPAVRHVLGDAIDAMLDAPTGQGSQPVPGSRSADRSPAIYAALLAEKLDAWADTLAVGAPLDRDATRDAIALLASIAASDSPRSSIAAWRPPERAAASELGARLRAALLDFARSRSAPASPPRAPLASHFLTGGPPGCYLVSGLDERDTASLALFHSAGFTEHSRHVDLIAHLDPSTFSSPSDPRIHRVSDLSPFPSPLPSPPFTSPSPSPSPLPSALPFPLTSPSASPSPTLSSPPSSLSPRVLSFISSSFSPAWCTECTTALSHDALFAAFRDNDPTSEILGFAAHSGNNAALGWFGPIGVAPSARGTGLGTALARAALADLAARGFRTVTIPWVARDVVRFYTPLVGSLTEISRVILRLDV